MCFLEFPDKIGSKWPKRPYKRVSRPNLDAYKGTRRTRTRGPRFTPTRTHSISGRNSKSKKHFFWALLVKILELAL